MKRACPTASAALVMFLSSFAAAADGARLVIPLRAAAQLCPEVGQPCISERLPAGADLSDFVGKHRQAGKTYRLSLQLPAGEFDLEETWRIDGNALPDAIRQLSISGSLPFTRLSGARDARALNARVRIGRDGIGEIELPASWRNLLAPKDQYSSDEPAWPTLRDASGTYRLTRWPREGWAEFAAAPVSSKNSIRAGTDAPLEAWRNERAAWALGFFQFGWHAAYAPLTNVSADSRDLTMSGAIRYGVGGPGRYRILNLHSQMQESGDYWFERAGNIHFWPRDPAAASAIRITTLTTPLIMLSTVHSVDITGIEFVATRGDGIAVDRSTDVNLESLRFQDIGRAGVVVDGGRNVRIRSSKFEDIGDQAVTLRGGDRKTLEASGHVIENCRISRPSQRLLTPASAIRLEGVGHQVRGSILEDVPQLAVYFDGNNHTIEANWFDRICIEVDDAGAIYAGRDWTARGNVIRNNVFTNIRSPRKNGIAVAIYLDDMLSGTSIENNAMVDVDYGVLVGGGRDNVIERNIFLRTKMSVHVDERARTWAQKAVAPGEIMEQRLDAMPTRSRPWKSAYPALAAMRRDDAPTPAGNRVRDNLAVATGDPQFVESAVATGDLTAPRVLEMTAHSENANELLTYCQRSPACRPFDAHSAAAPPAATN